MTFAYSCRMARKRSLRSRFYRTRWLAPVLAVGLAVLSVGLGQLAQDRILAKPDQPISFTIEEGLPHGITQETVEAAAQGRALSYEPFHIMVVGRELTWDEHNNGELPDGVDVMLSVGIDADDVDLTLPNANRVSVAKLASLEDWQPGYRAAVTIRETFLNNLTQGHGPSAVVGAAITAGLGSFDGGPRSPVLWVSLAALPLLAALLIVAVWARYLARERGRRATFARARLQLARVVLELDLLDVHMNIADAELDRTRGRASKGVADNIKRKLTTEWRAIRDDSVRLAHNEQILARELLDPDADVHERGKPKEPLELPEFTEATDALRRRVDALVAASSIRVGLAGGGSELESIALSSTLAVDEVLKHTDVLTAAEAQALEQQRGDLLALLREADTKFGTATGPEVVVEHDALMQQWRKAEDRIASTLVNVQKRLRQAPVHVPSDAAVAARVEERTRIATGGKLTTLTELRASLGLTLTKTLTPSHEAERVLLLIESADDPFPGPSATNRAVDKLAPDFTPVAAVGIPVVIAIIAGFVAMSTIDESNTAYGRTLTGDQPLASLSVFGDTALLPEVTDPISGTPEPANIDTLTLEFVQEKMRSSAERGDSALLPEKLDLVVALLPLDDYVETRPAEDSDTRIEIDYFDLLDAYPKIKSAVAASYPETIDPATGDVNAGYAILPLWIGDDGSFGTGLPLTGTLSTGVDSRLGAYYFEATELLMWNQPGNENSLSAGWDVVYKLTNLGREMEYNNQQQADLTAGPLFWTVAITVWTGLQAIAIIGWSIVQVLLRGAGSRRAKNELRGLRDKLNKLALGLDLSRLDAVAVLGEVDGHDGQSAEADQQLYEMMLFTAWREVQELELLPRRAQRGPEWRRRVERMGKVIDALAERDAGTADRALALVRSYAQTS